VIALWSSCGLVVPQNNPVADIRRKLDVAPELFLVGIVDSRPVASVMAGYEGHRGWINYLAVAPAARGKGYGRQIMEHAEQLLRERGCPKINLQVRSANREVIEFYRRLGFSVDEVLSMGKRLVVDEPFTGSA
jgi:ribosomal protein S18 acetylase RimI-like enzyme